MRSVYGREETLLDLKLQNRISVLALQETLERANDPPVGFPASTYSKPGDNGRRGVMLVVHPSLASAANPVRRLGDSNPNILWIRMMKENTNYYVTSVYLPDNSKDK